MTKKTLIIIFSILIIIIFFFVTVFFIKLFSQPNYAKYVSRRNIDKVEIELTLNNIFFAYWDKTIAEVAKKYPGGETDYNSNDKTLSLYRINVKVSDINKVAQLIFLQNAEFLSNRPKAGVNIRKLIFYTETNEDIEKEYENLNKFISANFFAGPPDRESVNKKATYLILSSDKSKKVSVDLKKDNKASYIEMIINLFDR